MNTEIYETIDSPRLMLVSQWPSRLILIPDIGEDIFLRMCTDAGITTAVRNRDQVQWRTTGTPNLRMCQNKRYSVNLGAK